MSTDIIITFAIVLTAMTVRSAILVAAAFAWSHASGFAQRRKIYRLAYAEGQIGSELQAAITVVAFDASVFTTIRHLELVEHAETTTLSAFLLTFALIFVWTEIWFYASHRLLHTPRFYWIHRQHHTAKVTEPLTSMSFSLIERAILIGGILGFAIGVSQVYPLAIGGLIASGLVNYTLNVLGHSNVEFMPERFVKSRVGRWFITPSYHAMHHARFRGHYGLFTTVLDRVFGTVYPDFEDVYDRARSGVGLGRLGERLRRPTGRTDPVIPMSA